MKDKHIQIRINQCLENAKASNCPRRKFGALIVDPERNVVLADGYNGALRGGGDLCGSLDGINNINFCARNGLTLENFEIVSNNYSSKIYFVSNLLKRNIKIYFKNFKNKYYKLSNDDITDRARLYIKNLIEKYPKITSGEKVEIGCIHAEVNTIINACNNGNPVKGSWLFINGEPCINCSKTIINAGIERVYIVDKGYSGSNGCNIMEKLGVKVIRVDGPQDSRLRG